jgi:acyl-coenzyme A thioesterase PaaI-like protein
MTVNFMKGARAGSLTATARVSRRGRTMCFCAIEVGDADGAAIAEGLVTYRLG